MYLAKTAGVYKMANALHVIVGIPGTGIRASLARFCSHSWQEKVTFVSLEAELERLAQPEVERLFGLGSPNILGAMLLPRAKLRTVWLAALEDAWKKVEVGLEAGNVLFTFHLCYFHHLTREHLVPADFEKLREVLAKRTKSVVTLIDDVYDCQRRLSEVGGRFDPPRDPDSAILDALKVLDWRSNEILLADWLADWLKCPHFLFGVKHPSSTFYDLLYSEKPVLYFSHPISELRRMWRAGFKDESLAVIGSIGQLVARIQTHYTVIEPTAIDEYRFIPDDDEQLTGNLDQRWPFAADNRDILYRPPSPWGLDAIAFGFPHGWLVDTREPMPSSPLLHEFQEAIEHQIGARDHLLVEQTQKLACYRPLFQGNASKGVREELEHLGRLQAIGVPHDQAVVLNPVHDRAEYPLRQLYDDQIDTWTRQNYVTGEAGPLNRLKEDLRASRIPEARTILESTDVNEVRNSLAQMFYTHGVVVVPSSQGLPTGALGSTDQIRRERRLQELAESLIASRDPYLDAIINDGVIKECKTDEEFFRHLGI